jgi:hypothetical protein
MSVCHRKPTFQSSSDEGVASCVGRERNACLGKARRGHVGKTELAVIYLARKTRRFGFDANAGEQGSTNSSGLYVAAFHTPEGYADCDGAAQIDVVDSLSAKGARTSMMLYHELVITLHSSTPSRFLVSCI